MRGLPTQSTMGPAGKSGAGRLIRSRLPRGPSARLVTILGVPMKVFLRYLALEASGWVLAALLLGALVHWEVLETWLACALIAALILKDLFVFPYVRRAYEGGVPHGAGDLLGAKGHVEQSLQPEGYLRVGAERWHARLVGDVRSLPAGELAIIRDIENLTLLVEPVGGSRSEGEAENP